MPQFRKIDPRGELIYSGAIIQSSRIAVFYILGPLFFSLYLSISQSVCLSVYLSLFLSLSLCIRHEYIRGKTYLVSSTFDFIEWPTPRMAFHEIYIPT